MITILHGDHVEASRAYLRQYKEENAGVELRQFSGKSLDENMLTQAASSSSLFGQNVRVIIEQFITSANKKSKSFDHMVSTLISVSGSCDIILWEDKAVSASVIKAFGSHASARLFALPVLMFQFLDGLKPGNSGELLELYASLRATEPAELIWSMMVSRIRQLIQLADGVTPTTLKDWQRTRLTTQANSFSMEKLTDIYRKVSDMEFAVKSGNAPFSLSEYIEQVIINL